MSAATRFGLLVVAATGCNRVFDLQTTQLYDAMADVNCASVTPDEDGDCVADDVDNCPGLSNRPQSDIDGDGVGDECDPRQGRDGDMIVQFDNFNDPAVAQQHWRDEEVTMPTQFVFEQGRVRTSNTADPLSALQSTVPIDHDEVTVEIGFDLVDWVSGNYPHVSLLSDTKLNNTNGNYCKLEDDDATGPTPKMNFFLREWDVVIPDPNNGGQFTQTNVYPAMDRPLPLIMTFRRSSAEGELDCKLRYGLRQGFAGTIVRAPTSLWPGDRYVTIYLKNAAVDIKWITLYAVR